MNPDAVAGRRARVAVWKFAGTHTPQDRAVARRLSRWPRSTAAKARPRRASARG